MLASGGSDQDSRSAEYDFGTFQVSDISVTAVSEDQTGVVSDDWIRLTSCLRAATLNTNPHRENANYDEGWRLLLDPAGETISVIYANILTELQHGQVVYCINVRNEWYWSIIERPYHICNR